MALSPETFILHKVARMPFLSLPTGPRCQVTYVWIHLKTMLPKSKVLTLDSEPRTVQDVPRWSSTFYLDGETQEMFLVPVRMFRDPFTLDPNKLVMCDAVDLNGTAVPGHRRSALLEVMEAVKDQKPLFGFEQEFVLKTLSGLPFGWKSSVCPENGVTAQVGADKVFGRDVSLSHYQACLYANIKISGTTNEVIPSQWEYQIGPCDGLELGDHAWMSRYILFRVCEDFGLVPSFEPKPVDHPRWASGGHMNFSTEAMRSEGGLQHILSAIERLSARHAEHMEVYGGGGNALRLNAVGLNSSYDSFSWFIAKRKGSVRISGMVHQEGRGYLEDRRPGADCDPYLVCKALVETCLLPPAGKTKPLPPSGETKPLPPDGETKPLPPAGETKPLPPAGET